MRHYVGKGFVIAALFILVLAITSYATADVTLPDSLALIKEQTFLNDSTLSGTLYIPEGVTCIGVEAFAGCTRLSGLVIPNSVSFIDSKAFAGCYGLKGIVTIPYGCTVADDAFDQCTDLRIVYSSAPTALEYLSYSISDGEVTITGFDDTAGITQVVIPSNINNLPVTAIRYKAFYDCRNLESIIIPYSVQSIGSSAFSWCLNLESVILSEGMKSIDALAFNQCYALKEIIIPHSVVSIGDSAFKLYTGLQSATVLGHVTKLNSTFRDCSSLSQVMLPSGLSHINSYAFYGCSSLEYLDIPDGVQSIGGWVFAFCHQLRRVSIPSSVTSIGDAFPYADHFNT